MKRATLTFITAATLALSATALGLAGSSSAATALGPKVGQSAGASVHYPSFG